MINLAIIGCGGMSRAHTGHFSHGDRARIVSTVDVDSERAQAAAALFEGARAETDYRKVLDDVDAVLIVLPHHLHYPIGMDCLARGKHVMMEKPMAISEQECLELIEASENAGKMLMIAYCQRFNPLIVRLKKLMDERVYGDLFQLSIWTEQHTKYHPGHWALNARTLGGGQLFSHGCHYIDLLLWFLGRPVEGTHLGTNFGTPWMEREGTSNVSIRFENEAIGYHFGTWGARGTRLKYSIHAHCTEAMVEAALTDGKLIVHKGRSEEVIMEADSTKHTAEEMGHFLECIENGTQPLTDGWSSLQGLRVIWRLYEAEEKGAVADLRGCALEDVG
ncbi:MAG: Gfo/Idh/MocA family oxidoreductase [Planctomycetota bacterium]|nr:Gfo/Idh/MocA family oxidoreductase [Planctomycetota bacterium]MDA1142080.1 Gfo/Idh/MocA family oxidoreductase [Planctomycetota bacterium]